LQYNSSYLELRLNKERLTDVLEKMELEYFKEGEPFHYVQPDLEDSILQVTLNQAFSLEGEPCVKLYLYVDDTFAFKTRAV